MIAIRERVLDGSGVRRKAEAVRMESNVRPRINNAVATREEDGENAAVVEEEEGAVEGSCRNEWKHGTRLTKTANCWNFSSESKGGVQERNQSTMHAQSCEYEACK